MRLKYSSGYVIINIAQTNPKGSHYEKMPYITQCYLFCFDEYYS